MPSKEDLVILQRINNFQIVNETCVKSLGPHTSGAFKTGRLFGGQTIAQSYLAFTQLVPNTQAVKIDTIFIAPGNVTDPLEFSIDSKTLENGFTKVTTMQNNKIIAFAMVRFTKNLVPKLLIDSSNFEFPKNIQPPEFYERIKVDKNKYSGYMYKNSLFELKPIEDNLVDEKEARKDNLDLSQNWARVNPNLVVPEFKVPLTLIMLLTDYFIFRPVMKLYNHYDGEDKTRLGSSLNHNVTIHHTDIDPRAYFLVQTRSHIVTRQCGLIDGQIFDENHRCILTYRQQNYIQEL